MIEHTSIVQLPWTCLIYDGRDITDDGRFVVCRQGNCVQLRVLLGSAASTMARVGPHMLSSKSVRGVCTCYATQKATHIKGVGRTLFARSYRRVL